MEFQTILYSKKKNIATIALNRPDKLNSIDVAMEKELCTVIDDINADDDVKAVILKGTGNASVLVVT